MYSPVNVTFRERLLDLDNDLIFVSLASYRDPQLAPTVRDCLGKASNPARLRFGICWQRDAEDPSLPFASDARFRVLDVNWRESKGACWARAEIMKLWRGEDWFLQVDSHCRFVEGWDRVLLRAMAETGSAKPILSTYASPFTPGENEILHGGPFQMIFQEFTPEGIPQLRPGAVLGKSFAKAIARPIPGGWIFIRSRKICGRSSLRSGALLHG